MITNKQYKEDMLLVLNILGNVPDSGNEWYKLRDRINAIPDEEPQPKYIPPTKFGYLDGKTNDEPHDMGNVLHIPNEDDK